MSAPATGQLAVGEVGHRRLRPARNAFRYRTWFVMLPMRAWRRSAGAVELTRNHRGWVSFHDADHGEGGADALAWAEGLLAAHGVADADGEIWLQTYPRVLGYAFKPVSFWYCERRDGTLAAVLAEVNNTFGERHVYLLDGPDLAWGRECRSRKVFHVSPFCRVDGEYRFRFFRNRHRVLARVDHDDAEGALLQTHVGGELEPLSGASLRRVLARMPLMTLAVIARIHWQALRLWLKRVPFFTKPEAPGTFITRERP